MTTHELASLLDTLRTGLSDSLKSDTVTGYQQAADTFRQFPDQKLTAFVADVKKALLGAGQKQPTNGKKATTPVVDIDAIAGRIRAVQAGSQPPQAVSDELTSLNQPQLKAILATFGKKGTSGTEKNLTLVKALLVSESTPAPPPPPAPTATDLTLVEQGVRVFQELKAAPDISIGEVRARMEPIRQYPKPVVEEISRRVGYTPDDTRDKTFERMLSNLEGIKMSQLRAKMILN